MELLFGLPMQCKDILIRPFCTTIFLQWVSPCGDYVRYITDVQTQSIMVCKITWVPEPLKGKQNEDENKRERKKVFLQTLLYLFFYYFDLLIISIFGPDTQDTCIKIFTFTNCKNSVGNRQKNYLLPQIQKCCFLCLYHMQALYTQ